MIEKASSERVFQAITLAHGMQAHFKLAYSQDARREHTTFEGRDSGQCQLRWPSHILAN